MKIIASLNSNKTEFIIIDESTEFEFVIFFCCCWPRLNPIQPILNAERNIVRYDESIKQKEKEMNVMNSTESDNVKLRRDFGFLNDSKSVCVEQWTLCHVNKWQQSDTLVSWLEYHHRIDFIEQKLFSLLIDRSISFQKQCKTIHQ